MKKVRARAMTERMIPTVAWREKCFSLDSEAFRESRARVMPKIPKAAPLGKQQENRTPTAPVKRE